MSTKIQIKHRFSPRQACPTDSGEGKAQQQFKQLCDLNHIMKKFQSTGTITHAAKSTPQWDVVPSITLHEAMNITAKANSMFEELPSGTRNFFKNDPILLNEFLENPDNQEKAVELGLINPPNGAERPPEEPLAATKRGEEGAVGGEATTAPVEAPAS